MMPVIFCCEDCECELEYDSHDFSESLVAYISMYCPECDREYHIRADFVYQPKRKQQPVSVEFVLDKLEAAIRSALKISDLWIPGVVSYEHEDEAAALHSMRQEFLDSMSICDQLRHHRKPNDGRMGWTNTAKLKKTLPALHSTWLP